MQEIEKKQHIKKCGVCTKQVKWEHGSKPETCPYCSAIRWDKPHDEAVLFNIQKKYLETKDQKYLGQMYTHMLPYATRIINKMLGANVHIDEERLQDRIEDTVTYFISYFLKRPDYYITESFGFQLLKAAQQQLYRKKQKDIDMREISYDTPIKEGEENSFKDKITEDSLEDGNKYSHDLVNISNRSYILKEVSSFIDKVYATIAKNRGIDEAIIALVLLHHYLSKKKDYFFDDFYSHFGTQYKDSFELEKIVLMEFIEELNDR